MRTSRLRPLLLLILLAAAACSRATTPPVAVRAASPLADRPVRRLAVTRAAAGPQVKSDPEAASSRVTEMLIAAVSREKRWAIAAVGETPDGTLTARVNEFREREGSDYGARRGAAVSLQITFVPARSTQPTWTADYNAEQQPLTYNLFDFWEVLRGGPRWLTATELARIGVDEALGRLAAALP